MTGLPEMEQLYERVTDLERMREEVAERCREYMSGWLQMEPLPFVRDILAIVTREDTP